MNWGTAILSSLLILATGLWLMERAGNGRLEAARKEAVRLFKAARWLAEYNYAWLAAAQDVICAKQALLTYDDLCACVKEQLSARPLYAALGQTILLDKVPPEMYGAAVQYNAALYSRWPSEYTRRIIPLETVDQQRIRQLQDALHDVAQLVPIECTGQLTRVLARTYGKFDPEEVLPTRY